MKLFGKKKETKSCCCGENCTSETMQNTENKKQEQGIKILGSGCVKCMELEKATRAAVEEGIIAGGGSAYVHAAEAVKGMLDTLEGDERTGAKIILKALEAPLFHIAANALSLRAGSWP